MSEERPLISFVVPAFNEEANVVPLYERVTSVMEPLADEYAFEFVFTDNHSDDGTFAALRELSERDLRVRVIRFSKNFGYQKSIFTGYRHARGAAAIQLDCDLQDPPELIPEFLRLWREGNEVVYGVRRSRKENSLINAVRRLFYRMVDLLSEDRLPHDAGDFRLIGRRVLDELAKIREDHLYLRGLIAAAGFRQTGIPYDRDQRVRGRTKFSLGQLFGLALDAIVSHSIIPLRIASMIGLAVALITFGGIVIYFGGRVLFGQDWPPGFATTTVLQLLAISLNALFLGIIGEYVGRIYTQVKQRPLVIIERTLNIDPTDAPASEHGETTE